MNGIDYHDNKKFGVFVPDDVDAEATFDLFKPFYGEFIFKKVDDWDFSNTNRISKFSKLETEEPKNSSKWKLTDFLLEPKHIIGLNRRHYYSLKNLPLVD